MNKQTKQAIRDLDEEILALTEERHALSMSDQPKWEEVQEKIMALEAKKRTIKMPQSEILPTLETAEMES